jgi:uncharacterized membrane protein YoaK (UPF0700 family)
VSDSPNPPVREKAWLALILALTAGCVDAVGYVVLWKVFTAHMSGNSVSAAVHTGEGKSAEAFHRASPIPLFVLGVALGAALSEFLARKGHRRIFAVAVALEASLLLVFLLWGGPLLRDGGIPEDVPWRFYALVALPTLAMGVQNATLRRVGGATVRTTYISGMLTNFAEQTVQYLFWLRDHWAEQFVLAARSLGRASGPGRRFASDIHGAAGVLSSLSATGHLAGLRVWSHPGGLGHAPMGPALADRSYRLSRSGRRL